VGSQLKAVKINSDAKSSDLKLWHYAVLIGVPSAAVLAFFLYKRYQKNAAAKKTVDPNWEKKTKSEFVSTEASGSIPNKQQEAVTPKKSQKPKVKLFFKKNLLDFSC